MSLEQRGAYSEMLDVSWQMGPLPTDLASLARLIGIDLQTMERVWKEPLKNCWKKTKKGLVNPRLESERKWAEERSARAVTAAKLSHKRNSRPANAVQMQSNMLSNMVCYSDPDPDPDPDKDLTKKIKAKDPIRSSTPMPSTKPSRKPKYDIAWEKIGKKFLGPGVDVLKQLLLARYEPEFGKHWMNAQWDAIHEWLEDNEEKANKQDWGRFILSWYRRSAERERMKT